MTTEQEERDFEVLLAHFAKFPKENREPTFMEICRYPYNRLEEVCSKILRFYLDPTAEHKLYDLWLSALWKVSGQDTFLPYYQNITSNVEEECSEIPGNERKRIDIVIVSEVFVVAIENKITASLYNPLGTYKEHITQKYPHRTEIYLVLTLAPLLDDKSRQQIKGNGFRAITYPELFQAVKDELGNYVSGCNPKYLTYMFDFMKTLENMTSINSQRMFNFFVEHKENVEKLIKAYNAFLSNNLEEQKQRIAALKDEIVERTKKEWSLWQGWLLVVSFNDNGNRIGIEGHYVTTKDGACGAFHLWITTWQQKHWEPYKEEVVNIFKNESEGDVEHLENTDRIYLRLKPLSGDNEQAVIEKLVEVYDKMKKITERTT